METKVLLLLYTFLLFCKYLTYKEWKQYRSTHTTDILYSSVSTLPIRNGNSRREAAGRADDYWRSKYLTYKEYNPTGILIYLLGFTLFSQKKTAVPFRILLPFFVIYTLFSFLILSTSSFITLRSIPNPLSQLFSITLLFKSLLFAESEHLWFDKCTEKGIPFCMTICLRHILGTVDKSISNWLQIS